MQCDLTDAKFHLGIFTEFTFVLAEGSFDDVKSIFKVTGVGLPPPEPAKITRNYFGNANFFGGSSSTCVSSISMLRDVEKERADAMFVILSGKCVLCKLSNWIVLLPAEYSNSCNIKFAIIYKFCY